MEQEAVAIYCPLLFLTVNQLCVQKDQKQAKYQAALQYSCSREICHYTSHIHWSSTTILSAEEKSVTISNSFLSWPLSQVQAEVDMHYETLTHTNKINLWRITYEHTVNIWQHVADVHFA